MAYRDQSKQKAARLRASRKRYWRLTMDRLCVQCGGPRDGGGVRCQPCRARYVTYRAAHRDRLRQQVHEHYGGQCKYCASTNDLTIHHTLNNGKEDRQGRGGGIDFYRHIIRTWPTDIELVCRSCHLNIPTRRWKLTATQVRDIRAKYKTGESWQTILALANAYGVSDETIRSVIKNMSWKPHALHLRS